MRKLKLILISLCLVSCLLFSGCEPSSTNSSVSASSAESFDIDSIPEYTDSAYVVINDNVPDFDEDELTTDSFETYSDLDELGRCGVAYACIGTDLMPTEERGSISSVKPTGWTSGNDPASWNRCHLIGYQLSGENANEKNLITGTRYMNVDGMLPFENMVADYVEETEEHVLYRVTPIFEGDNLVASGVQMEAMSVEDEGESIEFNVYCYNVQPGVTIDYGTGENWYSTDSESDSDEEEQMYIINKSSKKFHLSSCSSVDKISDENKEEITTDRQTLIDEGYSPCGS